MVNSKLKKTSEISALVNQINVESSGGRIPINLVRTSPTFLVKSCPPNPVFMSITQSSHPKKKKQRPSSRLIRIDSTHEINPH